MAKRTVSSYFLPKLHDIEKTNPENESDSDREETVVAKKGRKFSFRDEWLREFTWLRCFRETRSMSCTFCCRFPQHAGNMTCADKTGTTRLKHDTLIKPNARCVAPIALMDKPPLCASSPKRSGFYFNSTSNCIANFSTYPLSLYPQYYIPPLSGSTVENTAV
ncbi:hypothetical protein EYF80_042110 [Liparis tanakae]|uniref:Uncharacterized protein n=1 Tax=Liparis tanakae TaxID=230148 RepID=A0A4Z2G3H4_9TELE|nr:hypothetical protein EYF80_042110 [Liparis tanakae]